MKTDVFIIGGGLAGLYTALAIPSDQEVIIASKAPLRQTNSFLAQGGVAACQLEEDSFEAHIEDTLKAGRFTNCKKAVHKIVKQAPEEIKCLIQLGVVFDQDDHGQPLVTKEGGHSYPRVIHAGGDRTGQRIMEAVLAQIKARPNIWVCDQMEAFKLIKSQETIRGGLARYQGQIIQVLASSTVLATGGLGALYQHSTNPSFASGDGVALAAEAGAKLTYPSFVQFHPTAYMNPQTKETFLISEALRGEGGRIRNDQGKRFMEADHPLKELAPRDIVSRSIYREMKQAGRDHVWLDMTHKKKAFLTQRFPSIYEFLLKEGYALEEDQIPVRPLAHYYVGGITTDLNGKTSLEGLYAVGEVAYSGVHGSNRLASNSLLECLVFGRAIGEDIKTKTDPWIDQDPREAVDLLIEELQKLMDESLGIIRSEAMINQGLDKLREIEKKCQELPLERVRYYQLKHRVSLVRIMLVDAKKQASTGCHYKEEEGYVRQ